ncbi:MAG: trypsin [Nitrospinae bacterium CG11_big_fil_rev_8_21_14_0_20_45_15]|nr:MAG: trypsin [Nitrospinae bacterium CG11_big_fil_rev_8_21_14_0_20_45_15]
MKKYAGKSLVILAICLLVAPIIQGVSSSPHSTSLAHANSGAGNVLVGTNIVETVAREQNPAVVGIQTKLLLGPDAQMPNQSPFGAPPFPGTPFPGQPDDSMPGGSGSGFLIDSEGHILTNHHVVDNAKEILVSLMDGKEYEAKVIGADSKTDIALIKITAKNGEKFPYIKLGDSSALNVGEWVVAIGNPFGLSHSVTVGVVSAKGRNIGAGPYDEFIQTDASINPGNSGGPLVNLKGEAIGINTAILPGTGGGNVGIGFALPIDMAKAILKDLKEDGKVTRGWLGIMIQEITPELSEALNLTVKTGALVSDVEPGGPADKGGLKRGDVIVKFAGQEVNDLETLPKAVAKVLPGKPVQVEIVRGDKRQTLTLVTAPMGS